MINIGVLGGTGYTGVELLRLLATHPQANLSVITSRGEAGRPVAELFPSLRGYVDIAFSEPDSDALGECDVVFSATPNGVAMRYARGLLERDVKLIDLAADFRIRDQGIWEQWYGMQHACPELLAEAVYGLPEWNRQAIAGARLVANPGCYPTAVTLGLLPVLQAGTELRGAIVADAKSGVSGAGRGAAVGNLFSEVADSFKAYGVSGHRHHPEMLQTLTALAGGQPPNLVFVPHLTPMLRGIHATLYIPTTLDAGTAQELYERAYREELFVDVMQPGQHPDTRSVRASNHCRIALHAKPDSGMLIVLSVIDNLTKGAAGQAIQNMNIMFGLDESSGLRQPGIVP